MYGHKELVFFRTIYLPNCDQRKKYITRPSYENYSIHGAYTKYKIKRKFQLNVFTDTFTPLLILLNLVLYTNICINVNSLSLTP